MKEWGELKQCKTSDRLRNSATAAEMLLFSKIRKTKMFASPMDFMHRRKKF